MTLMTLLFLASDNDSSILNEIYSKHHKRMLYTATKILGAARAEEAVHDVFVKLIERINKDKKYLSYLGDKPAQFFVIIVKNHSLDLLRKEKNFLPLFDYEMEDEDIFTEPTINPETAVLVKEADDRLVALIRRLKPAARQILEYKYIDAYSNKEIAEIMGISQTAVSTRIDKAKKRLRKIIEREEA